MLAQLILVITMEKSFTFEFDMFLLFEPRPGIEPLLPAAGARSPDR